MKRKKGVQIIALMLIICFSLAGCAGTTTSSVESPTIEDFNNEIVIDTTNTDVSNISEDTTLNESTSESVIEETPIELGDITVKFIDVGQADSCLIVTSNNDAVLIDTGNSSDAAEVLEVLDLYDLEDIDLMVLTHPHKDHIGGAKTILETYTVEEVLMSSYVTNTNVFENVISTMESQNLLVTQAELGKEYNIDGLEIQVVGVDSINNNNDSSVVLKVTYGTVDMIFTGDAEEGAEEVILGNGFDLSAEILKVGHHGSDTSSSEEFLDAVNPKVAVISCGVDNKYNHPSDITIKKLEERSIQYYRTDLLGTVTLEIDGENIVTSFEDTFETTNARSGSFKYAPNIAELELELESVVVENIANQVDSGK